MNAKTPEDFQLLLLEVLKEVQELSGRQWEGMPDNGKPIGALPGFDSLCSIEATVLVEQKLGGTLLGTTSLFISDDGKRALNLKEIAHRVHKLMGQQRKQ